MIGRDGQLCADARTEALRQEIAAGKVSWIACLTVIGPSMADTEPAPRAHAQALIAPANQFQLFPKCQPAEGTQRCR
jgi:hypothetical protein